MFFLQAIQYNAACSTVQLKWQGQLKDQMILYASGAICTSQSVPAEVYKSTFIMCWNFVNLHVCMKEGPLLKPCQKRFRISWKGISIQMQWAWVSVLYLICGPIWDWGKRELIATNSWYVLISIVWIIFLFWTGREKKKMGLARWTCKVSHWERTRRRMVKREEVAWEEGEEERVWDRKRSGPGPRGTWSNNLTLCQHTSGADIPPPAHYETNSSPPPHSPDAQWSY